LPERQQLAALAAAELAVAEQLDSKVWGWLPAQLPEEPQEIASPVAQQSELPLPAA